MLAALFLSEFVLAKLRTEMVPTPLLRATAIAAITALSDDKPWVFVASIAEELANAAVSLLAPISLKM